MNLGRKLGSGLLSVARSRLLTAVPLFTYLFLSSVYFLTLLRLADGPGAHPLYWVSTLVENEDARYSAELLKQKFQFAGYGLAIVLILARLREFIRFWFREITLLVIFIVLFATSVVSDNPDRVVSNLTHLVFGAIAVWLFFTHKKRRMNPVRSAASIVFYSLLFTQLISLVWFLMHPDGTIDSIVSGRRQGGISGNPNVFGGVCITFGWAILTLMFTQTRHSVLSVFWLIPIAVVSFNVWTSGSASSQGILAVLVTLFLFSGVFLSLNRLSQISMLFVSVLAFFGVILWLVLQQNALQVAESATASVGKDLTFTGRLDLWLIALDAIAERPMLGWSYDNHETVKNNPQYFQKFNHFHNGFLDTLIVGGAVFGAAVLLNFFKFASRVLAISGSRNYVFPLIAGVVAAFLHNLTEYSMFRSNTAVWSMYLVCFISVAVLYFQENKTRVVRNSARKRKSKSGGSSRSSGKQYRW